MPPSSGHSPRHPSPRWYPIVKPLNRRDPAAKGAAPEESGSNPFRDARAPGRAAKSGSRPRIDIFMICLAFHPVPECSDYRSVPARPARRPEPIRSESPPPTGANPEQGGVEESQDVAFALQRPGIRRPVHRDCGRCPASTRGDTKIRRCRWIDYLAFLAGGFVDDSHTRARNTRLWNRYPCRPPRLNWFAPLPRLPAPVRAPSSNVSLIMALCPFVLM